MTHTGTRKTGKQTGTFTAALGSLCQLGTHSPVTRPPDEVPGFTG